MTKTLTRGGTVCLLLRVAGHGKDRPAGRRTPDGSGSDARPVTLRLMSGLKGLILAGGAGTRLRPITHTSAKQLVPVANRPVLFYGIDALVDAGVSEIGIVISPETGPEVRAALGDGSTFGARFTFIEQDRPAGLAHAMLTASDFLGGSAFVMYLGDNLLRNGIARLVDRFREVAPAAGVLLARVGNPGDYGVARLEGDRVVELIEKPEDPPSSFALVGVYMFSPEILDAARTLKPSRRGELEITEAIQVLIDRGRPVTSEVVEGWWKDTGRLEDMLAANRLVLEEIEPDLSGVLEQTRVEGRVVVEAGARVTGSTITGPAVIADGAVIENATIGPCTSVGPGVVVRSAEVENSILLAGVRIEHLGTRLEASLLGRDAVVRGTESKSRALSLLVGDCSRIEIAG